MANKSFNTQKYAKFMATNVQSAVENGTMLYLAVGRPQAWTNEPNDPDTPSSSTQSVDYSYWRDILGMKKIAASDIALVIPRYNWTRSTVYTQYDDTNERLFKEQFYTVGQSSGDGYYYVYKCLWNNNGGASDVNPAEVGSALEPIELSDRYVWKFMYRIDPEYYKFMTPRWIPVLTDTSVRAYAVANPGALPIQVPLVIEYGGVGYDPSPDAVVPITITVDGDGSGAEIVWSVTSNSITSLYFSSAGAGYSRVDSISVAQSTADDDAVVRAIIPPYVNHGYNPAAELGAAAFVISTNIEFSENDKLTTLNDYRRILLIQDPLLANGSSANGSFYTQTYDCVLSSNTGVFQPDDTITVDNANYPVTGRVVDVITANGDNVIRMTDVSDKGRAVAFVGGDVITTSNGTSGTLGSITEPELRFFSGDVLYVNHHTTIERGPNQLEEFKIVFSYGSGVSSEDFSSPSPSPSSSPSPSRSASISPSASASPSV